MAFAGYMHCRASDLHKVRAWSLPKINADVADSILDDGGHVSHDVPSCVDMETLPNNDKEKVVIATACPFIGPFFSHPFNICHVNIYSNSVHVTLAIRNSMPIHQAK